MAKFVNNISQFIQNQFPSQYREQIGVELTESQRAVIIDFVEAYYEWIESVNQESFIRNRQMFENRDVDTTLDEFLVYFRNTFLRDISYESATDDRYVIKHILDLYRSKGSPAAVKLLIRLIFNEDSTVYEPGRDILRASDSVWFEPSYIEVYSTPITKTFLNRRIFGSKSTASAFVEGIVTKRVRGRLIDVIYLSDSDGTFVRGDKVSFDGIMATAPEVVGSLSGVDLNLTAVGGYRVGDIVDIESVSGKQGQAIVRSILEESSGIDFFLIDGGFGYTLDDRTKTYISDLIVQLENESPVYEIDDRITQKVETVYLVPNTSLTVSPGDTITGLSGNTVVASGTVLTTGTAVVDNIISNFIKIQVENDTFISNQILTLETDNEFILNEQIVSQSDITLTIADANGSFTNGEIVYTKTYFDQANTVTERYSFGEVLSANDSFVELQFAYGLFEPGATLIGKDSDSFANILAVDITQEPVTGTVIGQLSNNQIEVILGDGTFDANSRIYGLASKVLSEVDSINTLGIDKVASSNNEVLIRPTVTANNYFTGVVVGQNTVCIGIANTSDNAFTSVLGLSKITNQNGVELTVNSVATGAGAEAIIASPLLYPEVIEFSVEELSVNNVYDVPIMSVTLDGSGSGVGFVESITVNDGGTGYTNNSVITFTNGGYKNQNVVLNAEAEVVTDANGTIVSINVIDTGEGYFEAPTISIADGSGANVELNMTFGYGFEAEILSNSNTIIADVLTTAPITIGTISALAGVKRGNNYSRAPFVRFVNESVQLYEINDQIVDIDPVSGSFVIGEVISQANTGKGIIKNRIGNTLYVRTATFNGLFDASNTEIVGANTGATAIVTSVRNDNSEPVMGENAQIDSFLLNAEGVIGSLEVSRSGYGYRPGEAITIAAGNETITGTAIVETQGVDYGYWKTQTSHISSDKYLHDNNYYQEYSYDIQSGVNLNEYREIILNTLHIAGTKLFGTVIKTTEQTQPVTLESSVTQE
jgi:hypothetical protein